MRHFGTVVRSARTRNTIVGVFAAFLTIALLPCAVAFADSYTTGFEAPLFHIGSVNGQGSTSTSRADSWVSPAQPTDAACTPPPGQSFSIDQGIVDNASYVSGGVTGFGSQSLRFSNLCANGAFSGSQIYSPLLNVPAGKNKPNKVFTFEFSFQPTTTAFQPGLYVSVSPDNGTGHRMFRVDLTDVGVSCGDSPSCVLVSVADSPADAGGYIDSHALALLDPATPHTIMVTMKFNGGTNDLVRVSIDGTDTGQCFTSWQNYYDIWQPENSGQTNSDLQFRATVGGYNGTNGGFLFDNVSYSSSNGAGPAGCDLPTEKVPDSTTVTAGGLAGYRLTVSNRGRLPEKNLLLCDHIPSHTTFVSADRKLRRIGSKRCLFIRRLASGQSTSVHLVLRVSANASPGALDNIADITPEAPPGVPATPPEATEDLPPHAVSVPTKPIKKVKAVVTVRPAAAPPVTG